MIILTVTAFWDAQFSVKSLIPTFQDLNGLTSPLTLPVGVPVTLKIDPDKTKALQLLKNAVTSANVEVKVSKTPHFPVVTPVPEPGYINAVLDSDQKQVTIPTQDITFVILTAIGASALVDAVFLSTP